MEVLDTIANVLSILGLGILMACFGMLVHLFELTHEYEEEEDDE